MNPYIWECTDCGLDEPNHTKGISSGGLSPHTYRRHLQIRENTVMEDIRARLEYLRGEIRGERISWGELAELQGLADYIEEGDVELLQWAGVEEGGDSE